MICVIYGHTDRSRVFAQIVRDSIAACGWTEAQAADFMQMSEQQLSRKLAAIAPLSLWELVRLPPQFDAEFDRRKAGLRGAVVLEAPDLSLIRGACALGTKRMAAMTRVVVTLPLSKEHAS